MSPISPQSVILGLDPRIRDGVKRDANRVVPRGGTSGPRVKPEGDGCEREAA